MIENQRHKSLGPEIDCRVTGLSESSDMIKLDGKRQRCLRRRRLKLRRSKSVEQLQSRFPEVDRSLKRKRSENDSLFVDGKQSYEEEEEECSQRKAAVLSLSFASSLSNEPLTKAKDVRSHGSISVIGRRREMEDAVAVELGCLRRGSKGYDFFGVYDGHGGSRVAHDCRDRLHKVLMEILEKKDDDDDESTNEVGSSIDWNKVMLESFEKIDEEVNKNGATVATMGSTAVVAVVGEEEVVVANCGDSRAVLSRGGVAVPLSNDHKPDRSDELERIELSGGKVINWNGQRVLGVLATSRSIEQQHCCSLEYINKNKLGLADYYILGTPVSELTTQNPDYHRWKNFIGDHYLRPYVISDPEVIVSKRTSSDEFLILASDGLWDVVSNDVACHIVRRCLSGQIKRTDADLTMNGKKRRCETDSPDESAGCTDKGTAQGNPASDAAAVLAELAIARGSKDNISVIVVKLRR